MKSVNYYRGMREFEAHRERKLTIAQRESKLMYVCETKAQPKSNGLYEKQQHTERACKAMCNTIACRTCRAMCKTIACRTCKAMCKTIACRKS